MEDGYDELFDDMMLGLAMCVGVDCRDPRRGPFVGWRGWDETGPAETWCIRCFLSGPVDIDPNEVGRL